MRLLRFSFVVLVSSHSSFGMPTGDHCCAVGCSNRRASKPDLSFHTFPRDGETFLKWVHAIKRKDFEPSANSVVCSEHFSDDSFSALVPGQEVVPGGRKKPRRLLPGAVPSVFSFRPALPPSRPSHADRLAAGEKRALEIEEKKSLPKPGMSALEWKLTQELHARDAKIEELERQVLSLTADVQHLRSQIFRFVNIRDDQLEFLTGLSSATWKVLWAFLKAAPGAVLSEAAASTLSAGRKIAPGSGRMPQLSFEDQLLATLMRFRLGRLQVELAYNFGVSETTMSAILKTWTSFLYLRLGMIPIWPEWDAVAASMPASFKNLHPDTFIIIDATELRCEVPSSLSLQSQLYSRYKAHTTLKGLVGIAPNGSFIFISQLFTGSISDKQLVIESGLLPLLDTVPRGKRVMADRGFEVQDLLVKPGLLLNIPPFKGSQAFMPRPDVVKTQQIASVRIHVERAICCVKRKFHIFDRDIPLSLFGSINQIWTICCLLSNLSGPLIAEK